MMINSDPSLTKILRCTGKDMMIVLKWFKILSGKVNLKYVSVDGFLEECLQNSQIVSTNVVKPLGKQTMLSWH